MSKKTRADTKVDHINADTASASVSGGMDFDRVEAMFTRIVGAITVSFNTCIDRMMGQMEQKLMQRLDMHAKETFDLSVRVDNAEARN